jgi:hypothetical protein
MSGFVGCSCKSWPALSSAQSSADSRAKRYYLDDTAVPIDRQQKCVIVDSKDNTKFPVSLDMQGSAG